MDRIDRQFTAETARTALVIIAVVVSGAAFYWLSAILTPLALALFLMVMIDGFTRVLKRRAPWLPRRADLPVAIGVSLILFCVAAYVMAENARGFAVQLVTYSPKLDAAIAKLAGAVGVAVPPTLGQILSSLSPTAFVGRVADGLRGFATDAVLVLIYLGFLLASRQGFQRKAGALFVSPGERHHAAELFLRIRNAIEQYVWIQVVACGMIALASWAVMAALGLDDALFWAFAIFIVGFIPIIGGAVGILAPPLFALVQFDGWWRAAAMLACLQVINFIVGNIIYPRMQGKSLNLDPVAVLLSLAFWGAIWGLPGMFLSTPLTVTAMVILAQFRSTHWIAVLLSSDGEPLGERPVPAGELAAVDAAETLTEA
ncbi:MAG: AI-2E family transporter [Caulobacteraceae bacterium]|nr:AI-2E family transporter [Caulobacteraceae bacterium]